MMRRFFTAMLAVLFLFSCAEESEYGGAYAGSESTVIYTAANGVTVTETLSDNRGNGSTMSYNSGTVESVLEENGGYLYKSILAKSIKSFAEKTGSYDVTLLYKITPPLEYYYS